MKKTLKKNPWIVGPGGSLVELDEFTHAKSALVKKVAKRAGVKVKQVKLAQVMQKDLAGIPEVKKGPLVLTLADIGEALDWAGHLFHDEAQNIGSDAPADKEAARLRRAVANLFGEIGQVLQKFAKGEVGEVDFC